MYSFYCCVFFQTGKVYLQLFLLLGEFFLQTFRFIHILLFKFLILSLSLHLSFLCLLQSGVIQINFG